MPDRHANVSILMPTYNRRDTLPQAIQSVISQTYDDWQLYVINDGGCSVQDIVDAFNDARIILINSDHVGKSAALNLAIEQSHSDYVCCLDDDDLFYPKHLETLTSALDADPTKDIVYTLTEAQLWKRHPSTGKLHLAQRDIPYKGGFTKELMRFQNHIPNLNVMHRRTLFEKAGTYDPSLFSFIDWDMWKRLSYFAEFHRIGKVTGCYRRFQGVGSISQLGFSNRTPVEQQRAYILNKLPGLTAIYPMTQLSDGDHDTNQTLSIVIHLEQSNSLHTLIDALNQQTVNTEQWRVLFTGNEALLSDIRKHSCFTWSFIPVSMEHNNGYFGIIAASIGLDRVVFLRQDMIPSYDFVKRHLSTTWCLSGPITTASDVCTVPDIHHVPAYVMTVYSDTTSKSFYFSQNEYVYYNTSFPSEYLIELHQLRLQNNATTVIANFPAALNNSDNTHPWRDALPRVRQSFSDGWRVRNPGRAEARPSRGKATSHHQPIYYDSSLIVHITQAPDPIELVNATEQAGCALLAGLPAPERHNMITLAQEVCTHKNLPVASQRMVEELIALKQRGRTWEEISAMKKQTLENTRTMYAGFYRYYCTCRFLAGCIQETSNTHDHPEEAVCEFLS